MKKYKLFTADIEHGGFITMAISEEALADAKPEDFFVLSRVKGKIKPDGEIEIDGDTDNCDESFQVGGVFE